MVRALLLTLLVLGGCAGLSQTAQPLLLKDAEILEDTIWQGQVVIDGSVKVFKGATLTILPGTEVAFVRKDLDRDGLGDGVLIVEGALRAEGTRQQPIRFGSAAADPRPGDWLEIRVDFSKDIYFRYCEFRDSAYTLHAHFTKGLMEDCTVIGNIDGCRLGQTKFTIRNCLFEHNQGKGINFRNSSVELLRNIVRYNGSGIFLFETDRPVSIHHNNLYGNGDNFRLGDFFTGEVQLADNWWGTADPQEAAQSVYDRKRDPEIGTVALKPASEWVSGTGPRDALSLAQLWRFATDGFVDAPVATDAQGLYVPSWDGRIYALDHRGGLRWSRPMGEVMDAALAIDARAVYGQSWGREAFALDIEDGTVLWRFNYPASKADDHRQGGMLLAGELLLLPAWNGTLYALDAATGELRWQYAAGQPLRSAPVVAGERLYISSGAGVLTALSLSGSPIWEAELGAPLLTAVAAIPQGVAAINREGTLVALDHGGAELWRRELTEICYYSGPTFDDGALYLATAGSGLWKIEAKTGRTIWRRALAGPSYATPLVYRGRVIVGDNSGALAVFGKQSGDQLVSFAVPREIQGGPVIVAGRLVFGARDNHVYALELIDPVK